MPEADVIERLVGWGRAQPSIRAMILTSSRARPDGPVDILSDYDVVVVVKDAEAFVGDDAWLSAYGEPMVRWSDQSELYGLTTYFRGVVYQDGVKIDYTLWPEELLERMLPEDLWSELAGTYVGPDIEENWAALFRTTALFRGVAEDVGQALGYVYPQELDDRVTAHLHAVRNLPRRGE